MSQRLENGWVRLLLPLVVVLLASATVTADQPYDFRDTEAYRALTPADRDALEQVHRDLHLLWGALDRYADEHGGAPPETLADLVPHYLLRLPRDPFAKAESAGHYAYRRGASGNRAWCIASAGLPEFPYLAARGNVGLYVCKGVWLSGVNPVVGPLHDDSRPHPAELRRQKAVSMSNLRTLAMLMIQRSIRKGFPHFSGKNFVLAPVAWQVVDPRNPESLQVFFSPGDRAHSLEKATPAAFLEVTPQSLKEMTRERLGIAPSDDAGDRILVGDDAEVELLRALSSD